MQNTVGFVQQQQIPIDYPTEPDWEQFTLKLNTRLAALPSPVILPKYNELFFTWIRKMITPQPAWATSLAAVATVILLVFQGSIISSSFLSHRAMQPRETKSVMQVTSDYYLTFATRIAETKNVFEKTNS
ncbi:MAG: hypothetical protein QME64_04765 [bacterium]|nr:hypothetical protein [bacterium]